MTKLKYQVFLGWSVEINIWILNKFVVYIFNKFTLLNFGINILNPLNE